MAKSDKQKLKLLYLQQLFEKKTDEEHQLTVEQMIEELNKVGINAERKSLYDDINMLRDFGYDIIGVRSKHYGYYLANRDFEKPELRLLVDAVQSSKFITKKKSSELIKKIENLASDFDAHSLHSSVYVVNRIKTDNESIYYNVDKIQDAISNNQRIGFKYFDLDMSKQKVNRHNGAEYVVSPWALTWDDENYYLIAYDSKNEQIRHYRVDKMLRINLKDQKRDGRKEFKAFDLALYAKKMFGMYGGRDETVTLRCDKQLVGVILDRFGKNTTLFIDDDKHFKVNINVKVSPVFLAWVFEFGDLMEVISPNSVKTELRQMAQNMLARYS